MISKSGSGEGIQTGAPVFISCTGSEETGTGVHIIHRKRGKRQAPVFIFVHSQRARQKAQALTCLYGDHRQTEERSAGAERGRRTYILHTILATHRYLFYVCKGGTEGKGREANTWLISAGYTYSKAALIAFFMIDRASIAVRQSIKYTQLK